MAELTNEMYERLMTRLGELDQHGHSRFMEGLRRSSAPAIQRMILPLNGHEIVAQTQLGTYVVVPSYNLDVAVGILRTGLIEPWVTRAALRLMRPGITYVNVGANFGYYTVLAASKVGQKGKVYSIEANPEVFVYLIKSIYWSACTANTSPYNLAVSDVEGNLELQFDPQFIGGGNLFTASPTAKDNLEDCLWNGTDTRVPVNSDGRFQPAGYFCKRTVRSRPLDAIVGDASVDVLHMDIEGSEASALLGARQMIERNPQLQIIMEWNGGRLTNPRFSDVYLRAVELIKNSNFSVYRIETDHFDSMDGKPRLMKFSLDKLGETGMCDLYLTKEITFDHDLL